MSTYSSRHSQFEVVPANGSVSDNDDSSCTATYQNLVRNAELFWDTLRDFLESSGRIFSIPVVGGHSLDLHLLFKEVTSRGGLGKVIKDRKIKEVTEAFDFKSTVINGSVLIKKYYRNMLSEFEHVYYFQAPLSSLRARGKAVKVHGKKSAKRDKGPQEPQPGLVFNGIIDGTFKDGCFVTVKMGSEELKGVLHHIPQAPPETQRRKKRSKSSQRLDSYNSKFHRSAYSFFSAEHYARLAAEYAGQDRSVFKEIENMWRNLSESERQVYQAKSLEDVQRYEKEMLQYITSTDSCAANIAPANDAAASASAAETEAEASQ